MTEPSNPVRHIKWAGHDHRTAIVEAQGDIDLRRSASFQETLLSLPGQHPAQIILDLSNVPYMDSSGVASLVKLLARLRREKVPLRLAGLRPRVRSVFEITRLDTVFDIYASVQEAMEP
jgi:anti-sigma B factor antagonist